MSSLSTIISKITEIINDGGDFKKVYEKNLNLKTIADTLLPCIFIKGAKKETAQQDYVDMTKTATLEFLIVIANKNDPFSVLDEKERVLENLILGNGELKRLCVNNGIKILDSDLSNTLAKLRENGGASSKVSMSFTYIQERS